MMMTFCERCRSDILKKHTKCKVNININSKYGLKVFVEVSTGMMCVVNKKDCVYTDFQVAGC